MKCHSFLTLSSGELFFAAGDRELDLAVNIIDDDIPEVEELFRVKLKNPKGGAEIGFGGQVTIIVPSNDDAHGVIGFAQVRFNFKTARCVTDFFNGFLSTKLSFIFIHRIHCTWMLRSWNKIIKLLLMLREKEDFLAD